MLVFELCEWIMLKNCAIMNEGTKTKMGLYAFAERMTSKEANTIQFALVAQSLNAFWSTMSL